MEEFKLGCIVSIYIERRGSYRRVYSGRVVGDLRPYINSFPLVVECFNHARLYHFNTSGVDDTGEVIIKHKRK